jgi:hypothetical protein
MPVNLQVLSTAGATRSALETLLGGSDSVKIASAFVRQSGVDELRLLRRPIRHLEVIAGTDFGLTQVEALEALHIPPDRGCRLYFAGDDDAEGIFHPKLYLGTAGSDFKVARSVPRVSPHLSSGLWPELTRMTRNHHPEVPGMPRRV